MKPLHRHARVAPSLRETPAAQADRGRIRGLRTRGYDRRRRLPGVEQTAWTSKRPAGHRSRRTAARQGASLNRRRQWRRRREGTIIQPSQPRSCLTRGADRVGLMAWAFRSATYGLPAKVLVRHDQDHQPFRVHSLTAGRGYVTTEMVVELARARPMWSGAAVRTACR
jgi:hypothetical protein